MKDVRAKAFLKNLIFVGEVIGFWAALGFEALFGLSHACAAATGLTVVAVVLVVRDVRKAWKEYDDEHYSG
jgi:hypothetical protein